MTGEPLGSVIIAAHNESLVIKRCLDALAPGIETGQLDVIVVCNGCVDNTAEISRAATRIRVVELSQASKIAALRAGDEIASAGPRIYLDADVVMTARAALDIMAALAGDSPLAGRPPVSFESTGSQWPVRRWYRVRAQLPSIQNVLWGAGTYALSASGRARFAEFPDIVSDDLFIDNLMAERERVIVKTDPVIVRAPRRSADLLKILKRTYRTQSDVPLRAPTRRAVSSGQRGQLTDALNLIRRDPSQSFDVLLYVSLIAVARVQARLNTGGASWERDESSRTGT
ncbi:hypothetical protein GY21_05435 [Cryobacterium roopkundense]|uniref:4,4'-diaponeurosporenoate glycosyltransferase n=1 Tax=Cryobacterium roopkundense TaxID=1001240 RepID=A0A099JLS5_9MICO|nr:glycosyltransferase [Cryobacterium roopkundense]KGJ79339.1 hypothetical protein GY21_05435 [Cryobacterium roopkundense]MBB5642776.1 glycosyltransferase involved in cell wall biosynthesis [Cryobacterium roopkundense]